MSAAPDVFLSYSREDQATARRFAEALHSEGFSVWWDQTLHSGEAYDEVTEQALRSAKAVVVLWSKTSVASRWVRAEATLADRFGTLVPAMIEACERPIMFELRHTADLSQWKGGPQDKAWKAFVVDVARVARKEASAAAPVSTTPGGGKGRSRPRWLLPVAVAAVLLVVAGALFIKYRGEGPAGAIGAEDAAAETQSSLAVLPFANLSSDQEQEYFSDGLTEEILNQLAQVQGLRLVGRTSSFMFKGKNEDLRSIGEQLGVAHLLEGSIRKDGENLRITAQLIRASDGSHLWSKAYDRLLSNVFTLQEEVARDVAQALSVRLDVGSIRRAEGGTTNVDAYDLYLRARTLDQRGGFENARQAAQLCRQAVALDPQFAKAWLQLSDALSEVQAWTTGAEQSAANREGLAAMQRVSMLLPGHWRAELSRISEMLRQRQWREADEAAEALMQSGPLTPENLDKAPIVVQILMATGRLGEAIRVQRQVTSIEPLSLPNSVDLLRLLLADGRDTEAKAEYERSKGLEGDHLRVKGREVIRLLGDPDADPAELRAVLLELDAAQGPDGFNRSLRGLADNVGNRAASIAVVREAWRERDPGNIVQAMQLTMEADALRDLELTREGIKAVSGAGGNDPILWIYSRSGVRSDPVFKELMRATGLADFWRSTGKWADYCKPVGADDFECH